MPLRDHFRPPLDEIASWEGFHGGWPMVIVQQLRKPLPPGSVAAPSVQSGSRVEVDVAAFEKEGAIDFATREESGGVATAVWAPARPSVEVETNLAYYDEYGVRVFDARRGRLLVAAIEIVSPANKDRAEHRNVFVAKCAAMLQRGVAVSIVDFVTVRSGNLYFDLLNLIGHTDPQFGESPPALYAASCRWAMKERRAMLEGWAHELKIGQALPTLPLWLSRDLVVPLELEASYEQACHDLWIV
jgi:hypothetical protein